ncbi:hypothetical protein PHMEG_00014532 [Phytophthora megakarya]|uniref:Helitron helicase n=1 Tax=Phytophthora megakarya TaxID=4795 RepID=A0A225W3Q9_9STRA|nr:hypothetical protein PHMEG_00014532 [Phytophthora megakarya]
MKPNARLRDNTKPGILERRGVNSPYTGEDGVYSTRFLKVFLDGTRVDDDGYPLYRHRRPRPLNPYNEEDHDHAAHPFKGMTDRVASYNPYLCQKYNFHVNVEGTRERDGNDKTNTVEERVDDIKQYLDARYLSPLKHAGQILNMRCEQNSSRPPVTYPQ